MLTLLVLLAGLAAAQHDHDSSRRASYAEPEHKRPATWPELAQWAVEEGKDRKVGAKTAETLDLSQEPVPVKKLWFDHDDEKDPAGWDRAMSVWLDAKDEPGWILLQVERSSATAEGKSLEAYGFVVDLGGRMRRAMSVKGIVGKLTQEKLEVSAPAVVDRFREEARFWRREAKSLPLKLE